MSETPPLAAIAAIELPSAAVEAGKRASAAAGHALRDHALALVLVAATLGAVIGAGVAGLHHAVGALQGWVYGLGPDQRLGSAGLPFGWWMVVAPAIGGLVYGLAMVTVRRWRPSGVVDPIEANALFGGKMSIVDSLRLMFATVLSNGIGASVGMEAAYTQVGSGFASKVGQGMRLRRADLRLLVGCGAAAGIAAAYAAPLAGAFYAFELVLGGYTLAALAPVGAAAGVASVVATLMRGPGPAVTATAPVFVVGWDYLACAGVGFLAGWLAIAVMQLVTVSEWGFRRLKVPAWARPPLAGLGVGVLGIWAPQVLGAGPAAEPPEVALGWVVLGSVLVAKVLASSLSLGAGFRGGLFSASLFIGGLLGAALAALAQTWAPALDGQALVLVAMGSVAAGIIGAPLTMALLVLESTNDLWAAAAVLTGVVVSTTVVRHAFGYSFATWRFHQRGVPIRGAYDIGWMGDLSAGVLMSRHVQSVSAGLDLGELARLYPLGSAKHVFLTDSLGHYAGIVDIATLHDPALGEAAAGGPASRLARHPDTVLYPADDLRHALEVFVHSRADALAVVASPEDRRVVGFLTESFALRRYSQELERLRNEETGESTLYGRD